MPADRQMPFYVCHKRVQALEIAVADPVTCRVSFIAIGYGGITVSADMFARYKPVQGDFFVVYEDGYQSFSPRKAFLDGYKPEGQSFADIKQELKTREQ